MQIKRKNLFNIFWIFIYLRKNIFGLEMNESQPHRSEGQRPRHGKIDLNVNVQHREKEGATKAEF